MKKISIILIATLSLIVAASAQYMQDMVPLTPCASTSTQWSLCSNPVMVPNDTGTVIPLTNLRITNTGDFRITNTGDNRAVFP